MAEEKKEGTPRSGDPGNKESDEQAARSGRVVTVLIVLVLIIILVQIVYLVNTGRGQAPVTTVNQQSASVEETGGKAPGAAAPSRKEPSKTTPAKSVPAPGAPKSAPSAPASLPPANVSGSAANGTIRMDRLMYGMLRLEETPKALTKDQASKVLAVLKTQDDGFRIVEYGSTQLQEILTPGQKEFFKKQAGEGAVKPAKLVSTETVKLIEEKMTRMAGGPAASTMQVPTDYKAAPPSAAGAPPSVPVLMLLLQSFDEMQNDRSVALSEDQAKRILPIIKAVNLPSSDPQNQILAHLTKDQKLQIDDFLKGYAEQPELIREYPSKLMKLYQAKTK